MWADFQGLVVVLSERGERGVGIETCSLWSPVVVWGRGVLVVGFKLVSLRSVFGRGMTQTIPLPLWRLRREAK